MTDAEVASIEEENRIVEKNYWLSVLYDDAVDAEIRKKYSVSQEFAILRQREEKPEEYEEYFNYCEACKLFVKSKISEYVVTNND